MNNPSPVPLGSISGAGLLLIGALAAVTWSAQGCATGSRPEPPQHQQLVRAVSAPARLTPPAYLPGAARQLLHTKMAGHARDMSGLVSDIAILDYPVIEARARGIASEARFAKPVRQDATELNSALPPAFFEQDRQLRLWADALAGAAGKADALAVAHAYGQLSESCVRCHAVYRAGP